MAAEIEKTDTQLMLAVREGDARSFTVLHERYQRRVLGFFYGHCGDAALTSDLCQETFLRIWQVRKRYKVTGPFPAYLFAIARMVWLEQVRRDRNGRRLGAAEPLDGQHDWPAPLEQGPSVRAARSEVEARILAALDTLPEEQRTVFLLRHVRGLSLEEIAAAMDCPVNTVRSRKLLAVRKLRQLLDRTWDTPKAPAPPTEAQHGM